MTLRTSQISALFVLGTALVAVGASAQNPIPTPPAQQSPYGGVTVEDILVRINDQIITRSDYDRAMKEMDSEARQRGETMQQVAEGHKDLLRNLIDQQLWLSKGKELGITGETEVIKQLDEIRKKYNLETLEDLEKAAREQGISYEDFKANIRNQIITQQVMRDQVGRKVSATPGEVQRYYDAHKQEYAQPESLRLNEILVSTGAPPAAGQTAPPTDDPQRLATAKAKADDIEARLKAGEDFDKLARSSSDGPTAAQGGDLGKFGRGSLAKVLEDATFSLKAGQFTEPIRTKQGYVIFKVAEHIEGGTPPLKDVESRVEESFYMTRMEPAIRAYLTTMREESYVDIKPGYVDTGASPRQTKPIFSAYTPPAAKKKKKAQRTRFRETEHGFRTKSSQQSAAATPDTAPAAVVPAVQTTTKSTGKSAAKSTKSKSSAVAPSTMKAGKKEKIRYGQAPRETLPNAAETKTEDAGAVAPSADANEAPEPAAAPVIKSRYAARSKLPKAPKPKGPQLDTFAPAAPSASEIADQQVQSAPLGMNGDVKKNHKKKTAAATTGEKTRMQERPKSTTEKAPVEMTPAAPAKGAPAPASAPASDKSEKVPQTPPVNQNPSVDQTAPDQSPAPATLPPSTPQQ